MPVGKPITECLQALGVLEKKWVMQTKTQWPQDAKSLNEAIVEFADSIENESYAHGAREDLNKWVEDRAADWVSSNSELWSAKDRLPHAPVFPMDKPIIVYWVQQYVLNKWHNAAKNRKKETSRSLPGLYSHGSTTPQILNNNSLIASTRDTQRVSDASSESHDLDGWNPYQDSESDEMSQDPAAVSNSTPSPNLSQQTSTTMVRYTSSDSQASHANNDPLQNTFSSMPAANNFRSRTYSPVTFQAEIYPRITFLIGPSYNRDGHTRSSYARIMGLEEAQKPETFRAGVFERLGEMGEVIGSRKLVAKPDWMSMPFVVDTGHDHHYLLETLKSWGEWKVPGLCVVYVSLEDEV